MKNQANPFCQPDTVNQKRETISKKDDVVVKGVNDLKSQYPLIANEWHKTKNETLTPELIHIKSKKSVWWQCKNHHTYKTTVYNRTNAETFSQCPHCKKIGNANITLAAYSEIVKTWDFENNPPTDFETLTIHSSQEVFWICQKTGLTYKKSIRSRVRQKQCPYCSNILPKPEESLVKTHPEHFKFWADCNPDYPSQLKASSRKKAYWICPKCNRVWPQIIKSKLDSESVYCPCCQQSKRLYKGANDLSSTHPSLCLEWNKTATNDLYKKSPHQKTRTPKPDTLTQYSNKLVAWNCKNGHLWYASPKERIQKQAKCPHCKEKKGASLFEKKYPFIAHEWNVNKNGVIPQHLSAKSTKSVWWKCSRNPIHTWKSTVYSRTQGPYKECPFCSGQYQWKQIY